MYAASLKLMALGHRRQAMSSSLLARKKSLKWQGKHRQKLLVFSDNDDQDLGDELIKLVVSSKNTNSTSSSKCEQEANMAVLPINDTD